MQKRNWKNQKGTYPEDWNERRKKVLDRDGYKCQKCGKEDTELHVHHRIPISRGGNHKLSNLITLCSSCHENQHPIKSHLNRAIQEKITIKMWYTNKDGFTSWRLLDPYDLIYHEYFGKEFLVGYDHWKNEIRFFTPKRISRVSLTQGRFRPPINFDAKGFIDANFQYTDQNYLGRTSQYSDQKHSKDSPEKLTALGLFCLFFGLALTTIPAIVWSWSPSIGDEWLTFFRIGLIITSIIGVCWIIKGIEKLWSSKMLFSHLLLIFLSFLPLVIWMDIYFPKDLDVLETSAYIRGMSLLMLSIFVGLPFGIANIFCFLKRLWAFEKLSSDILLAFLSILPLMILILREMYVDPGIFEKLWIVFAFFIGIPFGLVNIFRAIKR